MDSCEHACGGWSVSRTVTAPPWQTGTERTLRGTRAAGASRRYRRRSRTRTRTRAGRRARHDPGARHLCAGELCDSGLRRVRHDGNRSEQSVERQRHPQHSGRAGGRQRRGCGAAARDQVVVVGVGADVDQPGAPAASARSPRCAAGTTRTGYSARRGELLDGCTHPVRPTAYSRT